MFARCSGTEWHAGEDYPDFAHIRSSQSFNWSVFSIPIWTRFTDTKEYRKGYGVIGYKVDTIRGTHLINHIFENNTFDLCHKPIENNYSHCELSQLKTVPQKLKREIRMTFKHNCIRSIYPLKDPTSTQIFLDFVRMYFHRSIFYFSRILSKSK